MYIYIFILPAYGYVPKGLYNMQNSCVVSCDKDKQCANFSKKTRGENYFVHPEQDKKIIEEMADCRYTSWNLIHFLAYGLMTYLFPSLWGANLIVSTFFEYYELEYLDCHDVKDLGANAIGIMLGYYLSPYKTK